MLPATDPDPLAPWLGPDGGVVLVRHGRTAWNLEGRFLGERDLPLDDVGRSSLAILDALAGRFDAVYTSPAARARETAARLGPAIAVPGISEMRQGELEGLTHPEALARWPAFFDAWKADPERTAAPGGETLGEVRARTVTAILDLRARHPGARIAVVGHQLSFAAALATFAGEPLARWREHRLGHLEAAILTGHPPGRVGRLPGAS